MIGRNNVGTHIINIMIGLIIGVIIGLGIFKQNIYKGPDSNIVIQQTHMDENGNKYKWVPVVCICPSNLSMGLLKEPNYIDPNH